MAVIGRIRKHSGLLIIIIGVALAAFVLGDFVKKRPKNSNVLAEVSNYVLFGMEDGYIGRKLYGPHDVDDGVGPSVQPRTGYCSSVTFDPTDKNIAYATYSTFGGKHVWKSTNAGATWADIDGAGATGIPDIPVHSVS